ncbi:hypothetical protein BA724_09645 [Domibacillus iocasae]|uniref:Uncharacterized protein n=1 Tax=Domibacillus iocasae TaxID=1714016 RepID=A0A1E7DN93_9BACI|nr:hypothetical protein BA724_09645 [Domibacillus iocasae]
MTLAFATLAIIIVMYRFFDGFARSILVLLGLLIGIYVFIFLRCLSKGPLKMIDSISDELQKS